MTDGLAELILVTEEAGRRNLLAEGIPEARLRMAGNVMIDTLVAELPEAWALDMPGRFGLVAGSYALVTIAPPVQRGWSALSP